MILHHATRHFRTLDPLLGIFTGALAFYLHENNPRKAPPPEERLSALVQWKLGKWRQEREAKLQADVTDVDWKALVEEGKKV